jgi:dephospho-CoA kinase
MPLIGLTGGYASGKSLALREFIKLGARGIDCDQIAREVTGKGEVALENIRRAFGAGVLAADGALDRGKLAAMVFADGAARKRLEGILHPVILARVYAEAEGILEKDPGAAVVVDAPLLFEAKMEVRMDKTVVVACPEETQIQRGMGRDNISRELARARIGAQTPLAEKMARADYVIDNSGSPEETIKVISAVWDAIMALRK